MGTNEIFSLFFPTGRRGARVVPSLIMAGRRATNNSIITNLEDQNGLISNILDKGGVTVDPGVSAKPQKKRTGKVKKPSQAGTLGNDLDVQSDVTSQTSDDPAPGQAVARVVAKDAMGEGAGTPRAPGNQPSNDPGTLADQDSEPEGEEEAADWLTDQQQQQWLWQSQMQAYPFNPFGNAYGNFVPNFVFGNGAPPNWDGEEDQGPSVKSKRQKTHEISDDEDGLPIISPPPVMTASAAAGKPNSEEQEEVIELVKGQVAQVKESNRVSPPVGEDVAQLLEKYLNEPMPTSEMDKMAKKYPRVENISNMKVPRLDEEVYQAVDLGTRGVDHTMQGWQKGVLAAMSALTPLLDLAVERGKKDKELNRLGRNVIDALRLMSFTNNAIRIKRKEGLRPQIAPAYARTLTKAQENSPDWLYGGNINETAKQCETAKKLGDKVFRHKAQAPRAQNNKRFRFQQPGTVPMLRAYNPFMAQQMQQQFRFPGPQQFPNQFPQQVPQQFVPMQGAMQMGGYPRKRFQGNYRQRGQGFQKRGAYHK